MTSFFLVNCSRGHHEQNKNPAMGGFAHRGLHDRIRLALLHKSSH